MLHGYQRGIRAVFLLIIILSLAIILHAAVTGGEDVSQAAFESGEQVTEPRDNITVVTTSQIGNNHITAVAADGSILYHNDTYRIYNDVDPSPEGDTTVLYVATDRLNRSACDSTTACHLHVIEQVNLSTGETTRLYSHINPVTRLQWHDVDRIDDHRLLIADISRDRAFIINLSTGVTEWEWDAQSDFPVQGGGTYPGDWTHMNDVEYLDGRVMVNLRNQDQVVFIDLETGLQESWTLGEDDNHSILYEQHNPDYIPEEQGGPAILVGDSENNRVVEYQREDGKWRRSWVWRDVQMQWPRDADRLPNGHTLITDSDGNRVLEIDRSGNMVWQMSIQGVYDAERLGTGDESTGGQSAAELGLAWTAVDDSDSSGENNRNEGADRGLFSTVLLTIKDLLPSILVNSVLYVLPGWMGFIELMALLTTVGTLGVWGIVEYRWAPWRLGVVDDTE